MGFGVPGNYKTYDFLRTKSEIIRKNPALPDTPTSKLVAWSNTILDFSIKIKNLYFSTRSFRPQYPAGRVICIFFLLLPELLPSRDP